MVKELIISVQPYEIKRSVSLNAVAEKADPKPPAHVEDVPCACDFELMAKPAGPRCNLHCEYCFYLEKKAFFSGEDFHMADAVLEAYIRKYIASQPGPSVGFAWQGGEPTLMGIDFFRRALALQQKHSQGKTISNALQTNGTLLDSSWCAFLAQNNFLVGLSMDGPAMVHDRYRRDRAERPTHEAVLRSLKMMQQYGVETNVLATVNRESSRYPLEVYRFFREQGVRFIQFIPIVERTADGEAENPGGPLAGPPSLNREEKTGRVTDWSVRPKDYGEFLVRVFKEWVRNDVGNIFVMNFEWTLAAWAGMGAGVCTLSPRCGRNLILEHNGDIFSCDHFMYPSYRLGNILEDDLPGMVFSDRQIAFGASKETELPACCHACDVLFACRGGCPKHRFAKSPDGEPGLNYLCTGFKRFYRFVNPPMKHMVELIRKGVPVKNVMESAGELISDFEAA